MSFRNFPLRVGTRTSALAQKQTEIFLHDLKNKYPELKNEGAIEIVPLRVSGDHDPASKRDEPLYHCGGKGLFTRELELALLDGRIDLAVHSMKDLPAFHPDGLVIAAAVPREDARDVFVSRDHLSPERMPRRARIGTSSPRRRAQIMHRWPHLEVVPLRGNLETRLNRLASGRIDGAFLAYAGLKRLGRLESTMHVLEIDAFLPAAAQGIIGAQIRQDHAGLAELLAAVNCPDTFAALLAERAMLRVLDGDCQTPIAAHARRKGDALHLRGMVLHPDGKEIWESEGSASSAEAEFLGKSIGEELRAKTPSGILPR